MPPTAISQNPGEWSIESTAFEMRFNHAYRIWDLSGELWTKLVSRHPELSHTTVAPQQQIFEAYGLQVTLETSTLRVVSRGEDSKETTKQIGIDLFELACRLLDLTTFTRAGLRVVRSVVLPDLDDYAVYAKFAPKNPNPFGDHAKLKEFFVGNRYEVDTSGVYAYIKLEKRTVNVNIPWELADRMKPFNEETYHLVSDADFYTIGNFDRSSFDPDEWMAQAHKGIRRLWERY